MVYTLEHEGYTPQRNQRSFHGLFPCTMYMEHWCGSCTVTHVVDVHTCKDMELVWWTRKTQESEELKNLKRLDFCATPHHRIAFCPFAQTDRQEISRFVCWISNWQVSSSCSHQTDYLLHPPKPCLSLRNLKPSETLCTSYKGGPFSTNQRPTMPARREWIR